MTHIADNHDALLDYVYDEGDPAERLAIARHLQNCASCSVAVLELQAVRGVLSDWTPPAAQLGFKIVQAQTPEASRAWWRPSSGVPAWAQAAAAVFIFAAGAGVSQLDMDYTDGALTLRTQSSAPRSAVQSMSMQPARTDVMLPESAPDSALVASSDRSVPAMPLTIDEFERRMRQLIAQSEERQQRQLGLRVVEMARELDAQRLADMRRVQQTFGQLESQTGAEIQQQRQTLDYLVRTSGAPGR